MASSEARLSKLALEMFESSVEAMRDSKFENINFAMLLHGIIEISGCEEDAQAKRYDFCNYILGNNTGLAYPDILEGLTEIEGDYIAQRYATSMGKKSNPENKADSSSDEKEGASSEEDDSTQEVTNEDDISLFAIFKDCDGEEVRYPIDEEVALIVEKVQDFVKSNEITVIEPYHFTMMLFSTDNKSFKRFFQTLEVNYSEAKRYFDLKNNKVGQIPFELKSCLAILNEKCDISKPCEVLGREEVIDKLWNIMLKKNKRNAVIVGEPGVGKTALIEAITYQIKAETCPSPFKNFVVVSLDVNALIAGTSFRGDAEKRIMQLIKYLEENRNVILFIDEVHTILGAGSCYEGEMDLANALKPILARGDTIAIGATTMAEYIKYFKKDAALSRRFEMVAVNEPEVEKVYLMIANKIKSLMKFHGVSISRKMVEYSIMIAGCFEFEKNNPDKTLDLLDKAMVKAKRAGKKFVEKEDVLEVFDIYFQQWDEMSLDSKKEVAYHEAGHYIVCKASGRLTPYKLLAVSILPAEDYLGVTSYEYDTDKIPFTNIDYFIDEIAFSLGGRVAENMFRKTYTSGARADLAEATKIARRVIVEYGMGDDSLQNQIYLNTEEDSMLSEASVNLINSETKKIIDRGYKRAEEILLQNEDILNEIVKALLKNHIMSEKELDKIWNRVIAKRETSFKQK